MDQLLGTITAPRVPWFAASQHQRSLHGSHGAKRCEIQVSYAIGVAEPTSISVDTFGTGELPNLILESPLQSPKPKGILERFLLCYLFHECLSI